MPNLTDYLMLDKLEASRRIAGLAFYYPFEAIKKADGLDAELFTDKAAQAFWMMLLSRKDEITDDVFGHEVAKNIADEMGWTVELNKWYSQVTYDVTWYDTFDQDIETLKNTGWAVSQVERIISSTDETDAEPKPPANFVEPPEAPTISKRQRWSVAELLNTEFPEPKWAIPGLIPEGLTIIAGRPKVGKSWLALQAAISVGTGGVFFKKPIERGNVLYVALEDSPRRLQDRIRKLCIPRDALITFERAWKPLHKGGIDDLLIEMEAVNYRFIVFDTLSRSFPGLSQTKNPEIIGKYMDDIQTLATNRNVAIAFIDHTRKPNGLDIDPIDDVMNATEKVKPADCVMALYRNKGKFNLKGRGREVEEFDLILHWDPLTWCWQSAGDAGEIQITEQMNDILAALASFGKARMIDIAKATGINKGTVYRALQTLWKSGKIYKEEIGSDVYYKVLQP